jgi:hypothetical protein
MKRYHPRGTRRKSATGLPDGWPDLFGWADTRPIFDPSPQELAERHIARRARLPLHIAAVFAVNNGLGGHSEQ